MDFVPLMKPNRQRDLKSVVMKQRFKECVAQTNVIIQNVNNVMKLQTAASATVTWCVTSSFFLGSDSWFRNSGESPYGEYARILSCC